MKKVFIDSDLFVRDLRYPRDNRTNTNRKFLEKVKNRKIAGATSIFNLLEVCGILSFNLSFQDLMGLYADFTHHYNVQILFPADSSGNLQYDIPIIFEQIQKKQSLGDAQIGYVIERFSNQLSCFVSWNAAHFEGKISVPVKTPESF
jgi:predicted nucleic acid-binding protein